MVDNKRLNQVITDSGYKKTFLAKQLGIKCTTFNKKCYGDLDWKTIEAYELSKILRIDKQAMSDIFLQKSQLRVDRRRKWTQRRF